MKVPMVEPWRKPVLYYQYPSSFRGSESLERKLGFPSMIADGLREAVDEALDAAEAACNLRFLPALSESRKSLRAHLYFYSSASLPPFIWVYGEVIRPKAGIAVPEDGCEHVVFDAAASEREWEYRLALALHELGHALKMKHAPPGARSVMVLGLRNPGEPYPTEFREDDVETLQAAYGKP